MWTRHLADVRRIHVLGPRPHTYTARARRINHHVTMWMCDVRSDATGTHVVRSDTPDRQTKIWFIAALLTTR